MTTRKLLIAIAFLFAATVAYHIEAQAPPATNATYAYISSATTTTVRGNFLHTVTINGGTAGVVTLFDIGSAGCTGTPGSGKFATIETIGATNPVTLFYDLKSQNGGFCVVTAAATDLTISFNP